MKSNQTTALSQEMFQILKQFSRLKWENASFQELKPSECELLGILYLNLDDDIKAIPASRLSNQLNITPAAVTHLLNPLENGGFISRRKDISDRRYVLVGLTAKGNKIAKILLTDAYDNLLSLVQHWGVDDSQTFIRLLSSMIDHYSTQLVSEHMLQI